MKILEVFISKVTADDVAKLTNPSQSSQSSENLVHEKKTIVASSPTKNALSEDEKSVLNDFLETTLFDEGYEVHHGDIFHVASGRSLRAERFVSILKKFAGT